jgi:hypothetical protein
VSDEKMDALTASPGPLERRLADLETIVLALSGNDMHFALLKMGGARTIADLAQRIRDGR